MLFRHPKSTFLESLEKIDVFCTLCVLPTPKRLQWKVFYCSKSKNTVYSWKMACFAIKPILDPKVASSTLFQGAIQTPICVAEAPPRYWIIPTSLLELEKGVLEWFDAFGCHFESFEFWSKNRSFWIFRPKTLGKTTQLHLSSAKKGRKMHFKP